MTLTPSDSLNFEVRDKNDTLLNAVTSTGPGTAVEGLNTSKHIFQAFLAETTTPTATVLVEGSLDGVVYTTIASFSLSGSGDSKVGALDADYPFIRGNVSAITGTSAAATLLMRS